MAAKKKRKAAVPRKPQKRAGRPVKKKRASTKRKVRPAAAKLTGPFEKPWLFHDLRRTMRSHLEDKRLGIRERHDRSRATRHHRNQRGPQIS